MTEQPDQQEPIPELVHHDRVDTGVDNPDAPADDAEVDHLTREDVDRDPGEATRKLPKNEQAL